MEGDVEGVEVVVRVMLREWRVTQYYGREGVWE